METAREVDKKYVETGLAKVVFIDFCIHGEPEVFSAEAAHCAQDQGQFWAYYNLLFANYTGPFTRPQLEGYAKQLKLDMTVFGQCLDTHKYRAFIIDSTQQGRSMGFKIIPTLVINNQTVEGFLPFKDLDPIIEKELKEVQ